MKSLPSTRLLAALAVAVAATTTALAFVELSPLDQEPQWRPRIWVGGSRGGRFRRSAPKWATLANFDGSFNYCRLYYTSNRSEVGGSGWDTDFPGADNNFSARLAELTAVRVKHGIDDQPDFVVVRLTDPLLSRCPVLRVEDAGTARFSEAEVDALRAYLLKGGLMTVDDFWGTEAWEQWAEEIDRVLPSNQYPVVDIPRDHPIMHALYDVKEVEQVSSIQFWLRNGGDVSERGSDSPHPNFRGISDARGRLMVVMAHNTDVPDTWEREGESEEFFNRYSPNGYALGVNITLYALTH